MPFTEIILHCFIELPVRAAPFYPIFSKSSAVSTNSTSSFSRPFSNTCSVNPLLENSIK